MDLKKIKNSFDFKIRIVYCQVVLVEQKFMIGELCMRAKKLLLFYCVIKGL